MQFTIVKAVPLISESAFFATNVENRGESIITVNPQINKKTRNPTFPIKNNEGDKRQHSPDILKAIMAIFFGFHFKERNPALTQATLPIAIIINDHIDTFRGIS